MSVYFMRLGPNGPIKIGCAKNVTKRREALQISVAALIEVLAVVDGGPKEEAAFHSQFAHLKIRGELFHAAEDLMAQIRKLPPPPPRPPHKRRGRPQINDEVTMARFPAGTLARIKAVLAEGEKQSELIREAVERELKRRERRSTS